MTKPVIGSSGWGVALNAHLDGVDAAVAAKADTAALAGKQDAATMDTTVEDLVLNTGGVGPLTSAALSGAIATETAPLAADVSTLFTGGGLSFATIGNSIEEGGTVNSTRVLGAKSYVNAMAMRSAGRLRLVRNAGFSGDTTAQMLARFDTDVTPYAPKVVIIGAAENDLKTSPGLTPAQAIDGIAALVEKVRSIGALPVVHTNVPRGVNVTQAKQVEFDLRLARYAQANRIPLLDFYSLLVSETDGTLYATAANHSDGTHPTNAGAAAMADYALNILAPYLPPGVGVSLARSNNDTLNLFTNGLMITDVGADGVPDGWTASAAAGVTRSLVTAPGVPGKMFQFDRASGATRDTLMQSITVASGKFAVGDTLALSYRLQTETSTVTFNGMYGIFNGGAGGSFKTFDTGSGPIPDGVGYYEFTVPTGCTSIDFYVACDPGVGKVRLGQATLRNLTALAIA